MGIRQGRTTCSGLSASNGTSMRVRRSSSLAAWKLLSCTGRSCSGSRGARQLLMVAAQHIARVINCVINTVFAQASCLQDVRIQQRTVQSDGMLLSSDDRYDILSSNRLAWSGGCRPNTVLSCARYSISLDMRSSEAERNDKSEFHDKPAGDQLFALRSKVLRDTMVQHAWCCVKFPTDNASPAATTVAPQQPPELLPIDAVDAVGDQGTVSPFLAPV